MISRLLTATGTLSLAAALAAAGYWATQVYAAQPAAPEVATPQRTTTSEAPDTPPATRRPRSDVFYTALLERPLFAPTRRPVEPQAPAPIAVEPEAPAPAPAPEKPPAPDLSLLGVMGSDNDNRALVANAGGTPVWIDAGTQIAGWTVAKIGPDWLEISDDTETIRIEMYQQ